MTGAQIQPRDVNILLLGESGAGKSTFINSLANYFKYSSLEEAMKSEIKWKVPARFTVTDENYEELTISIGNPGMENYCGHIVTKSVTDYKFNLNGNIMHLIDTPPLGVDDDEENMNQILSYISKCSHLNAVVFFFKPNVSILSQYFKHCLNSLLSRLHTSVFKNIVFIFTHTRSTFYKPGETLTILQNVLKDMSVEAKVSIPCSKENMFCLDNETFRYLVAHKRGIIKDVTNMKIFSQSWNHSSQCCWNFMDYIIGAGDSNSLQPFMIQVPICNNIMLETIDKLFDILADISLILHENIKILKSEEIMSSDKDISLISLVKITATIACTSCVEKKRVLRKGNTGEYSVFKCIQNELDFSNNRKKWSRLCWDCWCGLVHHKEILYLQELKCEKISKDKERQIEITKLISLLENEMETVLQFLAECNIFRKLNSKVYNSDNYKDFLHIQANKRWNKREEYGDIKDKYHKKLTKQKLTSSDIENNLKTLYDLKYTGQMLRTICKELLPKNEVFKKQSIKVTNTTQSPTMKERKLYECFRNKIDNSEQQNLEPEEQPKQHNLAGRKETHKCQSRECNQLKIKVDELKKEFSQNNSTTTDMQSSYGSQENNTYSSSAKAGLRNDGAIIKKQPDHKCKNSGSTKNSSHVIQPNKVSEKVDNPNNIAGTSLTDNTRGKRQNAANMDYNQDRTSPTIIKEQPQRKCKNSGSTKNSSDVIQGNKIPKQVENPNNIVQTTLTDNTNFKRENPSNMDYIKDKPSLTISRDSVALDEDYKSNEPRATTNLKVENTSRNAIIREERGGNSIVDMKMQIDITTEDNLRYDNNEQEERGEYQQRPELGFIMDIVRRQCITIEQLSKKIDSLETSLKNNRTSQIELNNKFDNASYIPAKVQEHSNQIELLEERIVHLEYILKHFTTYRP